jgi:hypothetical protein
MKARCAIFKVKGEKQKSTVILEEFMEQKAN